MKMPLVRIKRMGKQFATCGVPLRPPANMLKQPGIKRRCPKLVPGQVVDLPADHNALNQDVLEVVRRVQDDEILRPWVFETAEDAAMANPSRSKFTAEEIAASLDMARGAVANADKHREDTRSRNTVDDATDDDGEEEPLESEARVAARSRNRSPGNVYDDAKPVEDAPAPAPRVRRRAARG